MPIQTLLEKRRQVMPLKHLRSRTEETYLPAIRRFMETTAAECCKARAVAWGSVKK